MIWIGTSGFQYPEWKGIFYPEDLALKKMLPYYAARFPTTEVNYSFRCIPSVKTLTNWSEQTPKNFRFTLKALQQITHFKRLRGCEELVANFWEAARTLEKKLGMVLFQLPPDFKKDVAVLKDFLAVLPSQMKGAFEFRHESWFDDEVFAALRSRKATLCIADDEKLSAPIVATTDHVYFRLRDVGYTSKDIARWVKVIVEQARDAKEVYVYFKHEETGTGPKFGAQLIKLLEAEQADVAKP